MAERTEFWSHGMQPTELAAYMAERKLAIELEPLVTTGLYTVKVVYTGNEHRPDVFSDRGRYPERLLYLALQYIRSAVS